MKRSFIILLICCIGLKNYGQQIISSKPTSFNISTIESIVVDTNETVLVQKAATFLQSDIEKIIGKKIPISNTLKNIKGNCIVIGTTTQSLFIKQFIKQNKICSSLNNKWEAYQIKNVTLNSNANNNCLVIAGSDRRGAAFGVFELSKQMGVSPLYWWADVAIKKQENVFLHTNINIIDSPAVKYRGIFINDEAPAFSGWTKEKFGGVNHLVYEKIFELILRLKGNYLWPAMWGNAFNADDTLNPVKADEYGIVMGTSHHEPMLRAQQEWKRFGKGAWDYTKNDTILRSFWKKGIENMKSHESILTVGMRGDGDMPMTQGTATELLERIVTDQRKIIEDVTQKPASYSPQLWALYKEVQDYYDKGMRVPDDVTLLLCDDNWGNIRKLPSLTEPNRSGGYGIYYHFDYVGGPRNYKWINTNNIVRVWEQMHLAYEYNVRNIWIVNVGDIKPMELPISFFLDYAWKPSAWNENNITDYYTSWSALQFGKQYAKEIGSIAKEYAQIIAARKPELIDANSYSLKNYHEFEKVVRRDSLLLNNAERINAVISKENSNAYYQLILHPIKALANLNKMYYYTAKNKDSYKNRQAIVNFYADKVKELYKKDSFITLEYHSINNGKWNHMMDQTHIGYTYWQQPFTNKMPEVKYISKDSLMPEKLDIDSISGIPNNLLPKNIKGNIFYEINGYVSIEAAHYTKANTSSNIQLKTIKNVGKNVDGISVFPVTTTTEKLKKNNIGLEYEFYAYDSGIIKVQSIFSPTLNFIHAAEGLQYSIAIDNGVPQTYSLNKDDNNQRLSDKWLANNEIQIISQHNLPQSRKHTVKIRFYNPGIIFQKILIDCGGLQPSYFGPPETIKK